MAAKEEVALVQVTEKRLHFDRVRLGDIPTVELDLRPDQRVISCDLRSRVGAVGRVTEDWVAVVQIETRIESPYDPV